MLVVTLASSVRLLNSFVAPANAANVSVPLAASRIVTVLVPATQDPEVDWFVHIPFTVHVEAPRLTIVPAVRSVALPSVHVIAVPGKGISAPAPQRLEPALVH